VSDIEEITKYLEAICRIAESGEACTNSPYVAEIKREILEFCRTVDAERQQEHMDGVLYIKLAKEARYERGKLQEQLEAAKTATLRLRKGVNLVLTFIDSYSFGEDTIAQYEIIRHSLEEALAGEKEAENGGGTS
jgi:hypothetical protein